MKLLTFTSKNTTIQLGKPELAKRFLPEWYRKSESTFTDKHGHTGDGLKKCVPFLDAMISGYMLVTPCDIYVSRNEDGTLRLGWNGPDELDKYIGQRDDGSGRTIPRPAGHLDAHLVWSNEWGWKAPRGYSVLVTHPLNRFDLPFTTMSGIIDSDKFFANGNVPFFLREDFVGTIPEGTPVAQLIPIKRKSWRARYDQAYTNEYGKQGTLARRPDTNYKKKDWIRKEYN